MSSSDGTGTGVRLKDRNWSCSLPENVYLGFSHEQSRQEIRYSTQKYIWVITESKLLINQQGGLQFPPIPAGV